MKNIYLFLFLALSTPLLNAQTRTTVQNGSALNPTTWDCMCIPSAGNTIIINHQLVLNTDFAYSSGSITVNAGASITGDVATRVLAVMGGAFTNHGTVTIANMYHSGGTFTNNGTMTIGNAFGSDLSAVTNTSGNFTVIDTLYVNANAGFSNTGTLSAAVTASAGVFTNTGTVTGNHFWTSGTLNHNGGNISLTDVYNSGTLNTNAPMDVSNDFWNAEIVDINHDLMIGHSFYNGDTIGAVAVFNNDGLVSITQDFTNSKTVSGSGRFCVGQGTSNSGAINGTLDICDQTGGTGLDLNVGTIQGTVTYCATACNVSVEEQKEATTVTVVPNPFNDQFEIRASKAGNYQLTIVNAIGHQVVSMTYSNSLVRLDASELPSGVYFYRLSSSDSLVSTGRMIKR